MHVSNPGRTLGWLIIVLAMLLMHPPVAADWLVSRDGDHIETAGPWQVKRSLILFTRPDGVLVSMRLTEIDLEASQQATKAAAKNTSHPPLNPRVATKRSVRVIDHHSVKTAAEAQEEGMSEGLQEAANLVDGEPSVDSTAPDSMAPASPVEVVFWQEISNPDVDGIAISGTLRNTSPRLVTDVSVEVSVFETEGRPAGKARAFVDTTALAAESTTTFRAVFPSVLGIVGEPRFEVSTRELDLHHGTKTD